VSDTHGYDDLLQSMKEAAVGLEILSQRAANEYAPIVESIIRTRSQDAADIERTLDGLLGFCGHKPALVQYRKLCRYYWDLNPVNTASYINAYREIWDSEEDTEADCEIGDAKAGDA
jgi:hypothetical protein